MGLINEDDLFQDEQQAFAPNDRVVELKEKKNNVPKDFKIEEDDGPDLLTLDGQVIHRKAKFVMVFFVLGIINHNGYIMVQSGAAALSKTFHQEDFMGFFQLLMSTFVVAISFACGTVLVDLPHYTKFWLATTLMVIAFLLVTIACWFNTIPALFWVAVFASILMASGKGVGEATFLGFCNLYPKYVVGYVSQGTGIAGLSGVLVNLVLQSLGVPLWLTFLLLLPTPLIYQKCAHWLRLQTQKYPLASAKVSER